MKTIILILLPLFLTAQVKVYKMNKFGLKSMIPSKSIEKQSNGSYKVYNYNNFGTKSFAPSKSFEPTSSGYKVYNYNNFGLKEIRPSRTIEHKKYRRLNQKRN